jgi:predicted RNA-binding protein with PIN domain
MLQSHAMPFLIDGHNLIGHTPGLRLDDPDDEQKLIELLRTYLVRVKKKGAVIFDRGLGGGAVKWSNRVLEVRFAPAPKTADDVIRERLRRERNPRGLTVVTSDHDVAGAARRAGAAVKDAAAFAREMLAAPSAPQRKESGLSAAEVEAWEEEFKKRGGESTDGTEGL